MQLVWNSEFFFSSPRLVAILKLKRLFYLTIYQLKRRGGIILSQYLTAAPMVTGFILRNDKYYARSTSFFDCIIFHKNNLWVRRKLTFVIACVGGFMYAIVYVCACVFATMILVRNIAMIEEHTVHIDFTTVDIIYNVGLPDILSRPSTQTPTTNIIQLYNLNSVRIICTRSTLLSRNANMMISFFCLFVCLFVCLFGWLVFLFLVGCV